jgi:hypothetical protein
MRKTFWKKILFLRQGVTEKNLTAVGLIEETPPASYR